MRRVALQRRSTVAAVFAAAMICVPPLSARAEPATEQPMTMSTFLDRLMMAESGGRLDLRNSRSTAIGPFQLIEGTFLEVVRRHFSAEVSGLTHAQLLAKRTDLAFSRKVVEVYTRENAAHLVANQLEPTYQNLRLSYLVGPNGAVRLLKAPPETPLHALLSPAAMNANPFMSGMTARGLIARAAREIATSPTAKDAVAVAAGAGGTARAHAQGPAVRCNLALPSCRKWAALHQRPVTRIASARMPQAGMTKPKLSR